MISLVSRVDVLGSMLDDSSLPARSPIQIIANRGGGSAPSSWIVGAPSLRRWRGALSEAPPLANAAGDNRHVNLRIARPLEPLVASGAHARMGLEGPSWVADECGAHEIRARAWGGVVTARLTGR